MAPPSLNMGILNQKEKVGIADKVTSFLVQYNLRTIRKYPFLLSFLSGFPPKFFLMFKSFFRGSKMNEYSFMVGDRS